MARYPFLQEVKEWVKNEGVSVNEILHDEIYERARDIAIQRVNDAVRKAVVGERALLNETDCIMEIFSYPLARMIVSSIESDFLRRRYALAEAKKAYNSLKNEDNGFIRKFAQEFGIELVEKKIHFADYLKYAPTWHEKWKLVNRPLQKGMIEMSKIEMARLLQEAIRKKLEQELLVLYSPPEARKVFQGAILEIKNSLQKDEKKDVQTGNATILKFPPCMRQLVSAVQSGINVPHSGRFSLVTFLHSIGMDTDEILALFSQSPDFNEEKTRYQIEHITGKISSTEYIPPKCSSLQTWGLCPHEKDKLCEKVNHPLSYYRLKWRKKK